MGIKWNNTHTSILMESHLGCLYAHTWRPHIAKNENKTRIWTNMWIHKWNDILYISILCYFAFFFLFLHSFFSSVVLPIFFYFHWTLCVRSVCGSCALGHFYLLVRSDSACNVVNFCLFFSLCYCFCPFFVFIHHFFRPNFICSTTKSCFGSTDKSLLHQYGRFSCLAIIFHFVFFPLQSLFEHLVAFSFFLLLLVFSLPLWFHIIVSSRLRCHSTTEKKKKNMQTIHLVIEMLFS